MGKNEEELHNAENKFGIQSVPIFKSKIEITLMFGLNVPSNGRRIIIV